MPKAANRQPKARLRPLTNKKTLYTSLSIGITLLLVIIGGGLYFFVPKYADNPNILPSIKAPEKVFNAKSYTLDNGLRVIVVENHIAPVVTHMVWYGVGAADETAGKSGIAHFLEHLMFKGSEGLAPGEFSKTIRSLGGNDNAFTSQDYTAFYQSIAAQHLEKIMRMEAGRMRGLNVPPEEVDSERLVILEERRQRTDNDPQARFSEQLNAAAFINHPYGTPVIGWYNEMENLSWDDAKGFYDKWYAPNNAILVVSGDVSGDEVYALAQSIYGVIPRVEVPTRNRTASPPLYAQTQITMHSAEIRQPEFQRLVRLPSYHQNAQDSLALQVLEEILGSGPTSRLYKSLVIEQKIASSAGFSYRSEAWDDATGYLYATPTPGRSLEEVRDAIDVELRRLIAEGITASELKDAVSRMQTQAIYARDSLTGPAMVIGSSLITGSDLNDVEYWPDNIAKVTAEQVRDVAQRFLDPDAKGEVRGVDGFLLPEGMPAPAEQRETAPANEPATEVLEVPAVPVSDQMPEAAK